MADVILAVLHGMVFQTEVESITGKYLYSDFALDVDKNHFKDSALNKLAKIPFIGIVAGLTRVALGIIHTIGHLLAAVATKKKGHLFHAAKGACEILRGMIEALPVAGRIFANLYNFVPLGSTKGRCWWMIKIYNPRKPDGLDEYMENWKEFPLYFMQGEPL